MIKKEIFGQLNNNDVFCFTLENDFLKIKILNYGGIIQSLLIKENGVDVVLGYNTLNEYIKDENYFGAVVGRTVNSIKNAEIFFHGQKLILSQNDGNNHIHGGENGLSKKVFNYNIKGNKLYLYTLCIDGEDGYPGNLEIEVIYSLEKNRLNIQYKALCDKDTPFNITNHTYFNLNGFGNIFNHLFKINCKIKNELNNENIIKKNYDKNIPIINSGFREIGKSYGNKTNIELIVYSDMPCIQFYTADELCNVNGKIHYEKNSGFCFETQFNPQDVIQGIKFLEKNQKFATKTAFSFNIKR